MRMEKITNEHVRDGYHNVKHPDGLRIFVYPKEGSNSTYAVFGARCGSVDTSFRRSGEQEVSTAPEGAVHFLEHKLFGSRGGDAFVRYAEAGAPTNVYISFDIICYLFSCTGSVYESLEILLGFVQSPYFAEQTVQKRQGITGQEIRIYDDDPQ